MKPRLRWIGFVVALVVAGCGPGIGSSCELDTDCADGLVCDLHDDQGTCQEPHEH